MSRFAGVLFLSWLAAAQSPTAPLNYIVTRIATNAGAFGINNFGQVVGGSSSHSAFLWTPIAANSTVGSLIVLDGLPVAGADGSGAYAINGRGQVAGRIDSTPFAQPFLWSPDTPNGTSGTMVGFAGSSAVTAHFSVGGINAYGQIFGGAGLGYLWTPLAPNGTAGTLVTDTRFNFAAGINDSGEILIDPAIRFTPSAPNSAVGTFEQLSGFPPGVSLEVTAINNVGTVLGWTCPTPGFVTCYAFLWTPASSAATEGSVTAIPGSLPMTSSALNAKGQVVGVQSSAGGPMPFLYTGGTVYDLSALSGELKNGGPVAINDLGQIVIDAADQSVYLLTPGTLPASPAANEVPVTLASNAPGSGFTVSGSGCHAGDYRTPQTLGWIPGSLCSVTFLSPQSSEVGTRYEFDAWQDGAGSNPRNITAPAQASTYTANFTTQYLVTARPDVPGFGAVSGGGWYTAGDRATLSAAPASGFRLIDWTGASSPFTGVATIALTVSSPLLILANFVPPTAAPPVSYAVTRIASNVSAPSIFDEYSVGRPINDFGQVTASHSGSNPVVLLWTPSEANAIDGSAIDLAPAGAYGALGINDRGQVVGVMTGSPYLQAFLWTPAAPNGTTGAILPFLGSVGTYEGSDATAINGPGQIIGHTALDGGLPRGPYLWTPSTPNGTTGVIDPGYLLGGTGEIEGIAGINDFGQLIATFPAGLIAAGTFTPIPEIGTPLAINNNGAILGSGCLPAPGTCKPAGWLWTPSSAHGSTGAVTQIPMPSGFDSLEGTAMNDNGEVVGILTLADGRLTPFLYGRGVVYDLSAVSGELSGGIPAGINDCGQIVINTGYGGLVADILTGRPTIGHDGTVYLLTPADSGRRKLRCGRGGVGHGSKR